MVDDVEILGERGEFMVNKNAAAKFWPMLAALNAMYPRKMRGGSQEMVPPPGMGPIPRRLSGKIEQMDFGPPSRLSDQIEQMPFALPGLSNKIEQTSFDPDWMSRFLAGFAGPEKMQGGGQVIGYGQDPDQPYEEWLAQTGGVGTGAASGGIATGVAGQDIRASGGGGQVPTASGQVGSWQSPILTGRTVDEIAQAGGKGGNWYSTLNPAQEAVMNAMGTQLQQAITKGPQAYKGKFAAPLSSYETQALGGMGGFMDQLMASPVMKGIMSGETAKGPSGAAPRVQFGRKKMQGGGVVGRRPGYGSPPMVGGYTPPTVPQPVMPAPRPPAPVSAPMLTGGAPQGPMPVQPRVPLPIGPAPRQPIRAPMMPTLPAAPGRLPVLGASAGIPTPTVPAGGMGQLPAVMPTPNPTQAAMGQALQTQAAPYVPQPMVGRTGIRRMYGGPIGRPFGGEPLHMRRGGVVDDRVPTDPVEPEPVPTPLPGAVTDPAAQQRAAEVAARAALVDTSGGVDMSGGVEVPSIYDNWQSSDLAGAGLMEGVDFEAIKAQRMQEMEDQMNLVSGRFMGLGGASSGAHGRVLGEAAARAMTGLGAEEAAFNLQQQDAMRNALLAQSGVNLQGATAEQQGALGAGNLAMTGRGLDLRGYEAETGRLGTTLQGMQLPMQGYGQLMQMGAVPRGVEQTELQGQYADWTRQNPAWTELYNAGLGYGNVGTKAYQPATQEQAPWWQQFIAGAAPAIGTGIGWALGGPAGAVPGAAVGNAASKLMQPAPQYKFGQGVNW